MSKWFLSFKFVNQQVGIYNPRQLPSGWWSFRACPYCSWGMV